MNVPMLDLVAQYSTIKDEVLAAMMKVVETRCSSWARGAGARNRRRQAVACQTRHRLRERHRCAALAAQGAESPAGR